MIQFKFELGQKVRDIITGLEGIVTSRTEYLTGCAHIGVQPQQLKDGKMVDPEWIDQTRLVFVDEGIRPEYVSPETSGPEHNPPNL